MNLTPNASPALDDTSFVDPSVGTDRRTRERSARASKARRESGRRQKVDPTTCEREYTAAELEFMQAIQAYKQSSGRMFPTWSEVLEVLKSLGYQKTS